LVAGPPTGCVPKVFLYRILSAFSSFTNSLRGQMLTSDPACCAPTHMNGVSQVLTMKGRPSGPK
jgi:hypothetical protein